jgi:hypothetical protein
MLPSMLRIRKAQMRAMLRPMRTPFVERLMTGFREIWPGKAAQLGARYREFIESSVDRATSYGIMTESCISRFVNLDFVWGAEFEIDPSHDWALRALKDPQMNEKAKLHELVSQTRLKLIAIHSGKGQKG